MTGVQTCALPICFPVTIQMQAWLEHLISEGQSLENDVAAYQAAKLAEQQQSTETLQNAQSSTE